MNVLMYPRTGGGSVTTMRLKDERRFLTDPDEVIYLTFPQEDKAWQLLDGEPWSLRKFLETPYFTHAYFQSEWKLAARHKSVVKAPKGKCCITFDKIPEDLDITYKIMYKLYFNERKSKKKLSKKLQLTKFIIPVDRTSVYTRLPDTGIYKLEILDQNRDTLCKMRIDSTGDINNQMSFPEIPELGFGFNQEAVSAGLVDPSRDEGLVIAKEGEKVRFKFTTRKPLQVQARLVHNWQSSQQLESRITQEQEDDTVTIEVKVPYETHNPEYSLQVNAKEKDSDEPYVNLLNYLLTHDKDLVYAKKGRAQHVHDELIAAVGGQDIHRLESALKELRHAGGRKRKSKVVTEAFEKLNYLHQNAIQEALGIQKEEELRTALNEADQSMARYFIHLSDVYGQAQVEMRRLKRLSRGLHEVKELSSAQMSEVLRYNHPHPVVVAVLKAVFFLLGENIDELKEWKHVQTLLRRQGKKSIRCLISNHDVSSVDKERMARASILLNTTSAEGVRCRSVGAAAFYAWCKAVVESQAGDSENASVIEETQDGTESDTDNTINNKNENELEP